MQLILLCRHICDRMCITQTLRPALRLKLGVASKIIIIHPSLLGLPARTSLMLAICIINK